MRSKPASPRLQKQPSTGRAINVLSAFAPPPPVWNLLGFSGPTALCNSAYLLTVLTGRLFYYIPTHRFLSNSVPLLFDPLKVFSDFSGKTLAISRKISYYTIAGSMNCGQAAGCWRTPQPCTSDTGTQHSNLMNDCTRGLLYPFSADIARAEIGNVIAVRSH